MEAVTSSFKRHAVAPCETAKLCSFATCFYSCLAAISLITTIVAVFFTITEINPWYTLVASAAPESVRGALGTIFLVRFVVAINCVVTSP